MSTPLGSAHRARCCGRCGGFAARVIAAFGLVLAVLALAVLHRHQATLWNRELSALSPISAEDQNYDAKLRADLGAADVRELVIVSGPTLGVRARRRRTRGRALEALVDAKVIGGFDSPANYLPSAAAQEARRDSLARARRNCATICGRPRRA